MIKRIGASKSATITLPAALGKNRTSGANNTAMGNIRRPAGLLLITVIAALAAGLWIDHQRFNRAAPPSVLGRSEKVGLLGAPLPIGAVLSKQVGADPVSGDTGEAYSIPASMNDILAFFDEAMIADGWQKSAPDTKSSRAYAKGVRNLILIATVDGSGFVLTGH